jgi:hypothetical protein
MSKSAERRTMAEIRREMTDAEWEQSWRNSKKRFPEQERAYYGPREAPMGTTFAAAVDRLIGRGTARRVPARRGCE